LSYGRPLRKTTRGSPCAPRVRGRPRTALKS